MPSLQVACPEQVEDESGVRPCDQKGWIKWTGKGLPPPTWTAVTQCSKGHTFKVTAPYVEKIVGKAKVLK